MTDHWKILRSFLRTTAAVHKRRCAIRQGRREPQVCVGPHRWNHLRQWCEDCGITRKEMIEKMIEKE